MTGRGSRRRRGCRLDSGLPLRTRAIRWSGKLAVATTIALALPLIFTSPRPAHAFDIDKAATLIPGLNPHGGTAIHEGITSDGILSVSPNIDPSVILNLQRGNENTDITHQFDSESHFDNSSVALGVGFQPGFDTINARLNEAVSFARGNPEFLSPHNTTFLGIASDVDLTLLKLVVDTDCLASATCPTTQFTADAAVISAADLPPLLINNSPDPHEPTSSSSPFSQHPGANCGACGVLGDVNALYGGVVQDVEARVDAALGPHSSILCGCTQTLAESIGSGHPLVLELESERNQLRAYRAYQDLGHAFHSTQDFFAHSNYVELMAGVAVGQAISGPVDSIPVVSDYGHFNLNGLHQLMGDARYQQLETGSVVTFWLNEGDACLGNFFNPGTSITIGGVAGLPFVSFILSAGGSNPDPAPGFHYCHYQTATNVGLNKDDPDPGQPAHANYAYARSAATRLSALLWRAFLGQILPKTSPTIATQATALANTGGTISDTATLAAGNAPTGAISFNLFGPDNATCSGAPIFGSIKPVNGNGSYTSGTFTPVLPGAYRWVASYGGDDINNAVTTACSDAGERSMVTKASPTITTQATASATTIGTISDTAVLSGGNAPTGTITFNLFGPNNTTCTGAPVFGSNKPVNGNGSYTSDPYNPFTPVPPGTYRWVASYSGDANNNAAATACNDLGETSAVTQASPGDLSTVVGQLLTAGCIDNAGIANALTAKLTAAQNAITAGNLKTAINILSALIHQVQAQSGKHILASCTMAGVTFDPAAVLIADARSIVDSLTVTATLNPITGSVVTATGSGISGATVSLVDASGTTLATATTDVTGFYFFPTTGLLSASATYSISVTGLPTGFTSSSPAQTFTWAGSPVSLNNFTLTS